MELWELIAREHVRDTIARYNQYGDGGRFDDILTLFAPDAELRTDDETASGHDELRAFFTRVAGPTPSYVRHCTTTLQIDVSSPTTATARCYFFVLTSDGLDHWGRYADSLAEQDGRWVFTKRRVRLDGMEPDGWAAAYEQRRTQQRRTSHEP